LGDTHVLSLRPLLHHGFEIIEGRFDTALTAPDVHSEFIWIQAFRIKFRVRYGHVGCSDSKLNNPVGPFRFLVVHPWGGIEIFDFCSEGNRAVADVERGQRTDTILPFP
jgi:hypothetical protein